MKSLALLEGGKGWATAGDKHVEHMVNYNLKFWS